MRALVLTFLAAILLAGCTTGNDAQTAQGYESPPAGGGPVVALMAKDVAFTASKLDVSAGTPFVIAFENRENLPHNVSIYTDEAGTNRVFEGITFTGPATRWYSVPALAAGTYVFKCDLHPNMTGRLRAI